jgi:RNA polymerase sigma factor (sigma-70 family)
VAAKASPPRTSKKHSGSTKPKEVLGIYFNQIKSLGLLTKTDELSMAKRLEDAETEMWRELLQSTSGTEVIARVRTVFAEREELTLTHAKLPDFQEPVESVASVLRRLDRERIYSLSVLSSVTLDPEVLARVHTLQREAETLRTRFITCNVRLVILVAKQWIRSGVPLGDLIQEGNLGLMYAVQLYDYRKGFRFATYAVLWIKQHIARAIDNKERAVRIPIHAIESAQKRRKHSKALFSALGREPTLDELATASGMSSAKLEDAERLSRALGPAISLDGPISVADENSLSLLDTLMATDASTSALESMIAGETHARLMKAVAQLPVRLANVVRKRFGLKDPEATVEPSERTLANIGDDFGVSRERVRQLEKEALSALRKTLREEDR